MTLKYFYSRPCGRGDWRQYYGLQAENPHFYSRPCGRGDPVELWPIPPHWIFLLTPLREGRPEQRRAAVVIDTISTHAPAGGATHRSQNGVTVPIISTHAPAGGATAACAPTPAARPSFLLTPLREGRLVHICENGGRIIISTHAPAGGATDIGNAFKHPIHISTHAPAGGATPATPQAMNRQAAISTHAPAGGATRPSRVSGSWTQFLLTPLREGRRIRNWNKAAPSAISTHAPAGGATQAAHHIHKGGIFLLTPLREGRRRPDQERPGGI